MTPPLAAPVPNPRWRLLASVSLVLLILLCLAWELWLAPLRPGGSWLVIKVLPLLLPLRGVLRGNLYTYQWAAMLSLVYVMEGAVRGMSDAAPASAWLGWAELALALVFFVSAVCYVRPAKRASRQLAARR